MVSTFKQATVTVVMLLIIAGIVLFIKRFIVVKYLRHSLQKKYPIEDAKRIESLISLGGAVIFIIVTVWMFVTLFG